MQKRDVVQAKKMSFKLPFSFIQSDWKRANLQELKQAHQFLCTVDYNLKTGGGDYGLELMYEKFFLGQFVQ